MWGAEPCSPEPPCDSCTCPRQPCTDFFAEDLIEGSERVREDGIEGLENCGCRAGECPGGNDQWYRRIASRFDRLFFFCVFRAEKLSRKARQKARNELARPFSRTRLPRKSSVTPRIHPRSPVVHFDPYNVLRCCCSGQDDPHEVVLRPLHQARSPFPQRHQGSRAPYPLRRRREGGGRFRTSQRRHRRCRVRPLLEDRRPRRRRSVAPEGACAIHLVDILIPPPGTAVRFSSTPPPPQTSR